MHPKMLPILKPKAWATAIIAMNLVPLAFMMYADRVMNVWLPSLFVVLVPLFLMLYQSNPSVSNNTMHPVSAIGKIIALSLGSLVTLFMIAYFSLSFQPLIATDTETALWVTLPGAESMAYVIRLFLQAWLFALVCMMAARWLKHQRHYSGFLLRFYEKKDILPWLLDFVAIGGVIFLVSVLIILVTQQLLYLSSRLLGFEHIFTFPQMSFFLFLFSIFALNKSTSIFKRMVNHAKKTDTSMPLLYVALMGFLIGTWVFTQFALLGLPDGMQDQLAQGLNTHYASFDKVARNWPTLIIGCSFFMVAPLSVLLAQLLTSRTLLIVGLIVPVALAAFFLSVFPSINAEFWTWVPQLHFATTPITDALAQFSFNGFSIVLILLVAGMLCAMRNGGLWMRSMVDMSPDTLGRRERRVRENFTKFFKALCFIYAIFGLLGVYGLALTAAAYIPTTLTLCGVLIFLALQQRYGEVTSSWQVFSKGD